MRRYAAVNRQGLSEASSLPRGALGVSLDEAHLPEA